MSASALEQVAFEQAGHIGDARDDVSESRLAELAEVVAPREHADYRRVRTLVPYPEQSPWQRPTREKPKQPGQNFGMRWGIDE